MDPNPLLRPSDEVNGKTTARTVQLCDEVAKLFGKWLYTTPLQRVAGNEEAGLKGSASKARASTSSWPFPSQPLEAHNFLFPGAMAGSAARCWDKPVSVKAYHLHIKNIAQFLKRDLRSALEEVGTHEFEGFPLDRLGTHSLKRTCVCLMKDTGISTKMVAAISGTTVPVLDRYYDTPTTKRCRKVVTETFASIAGEIDASTGGEGHGATTTPADIIASSFDSGGHEKHEAAFCGKCGKQRLDRSWVLCPWCGCMFAGPWV